MNTLQKRWLEKRFGPSVRFGEPMSRHTSWRVGGPVEAYVVPETDAELADLMTWTRENGMNRKVIGNGTNLLAKDGGIDGVVIGRAIGSKEIREAGAVVYASAGVGLQSLCRFANRRGLAGMNFAVGIPGTVGGAVAMNAGTPSGCMGDVLESVDMLRDTGEFETVERKDLDFQYRSLKFGELQSCKLQSCKVQRGKYETNDRPVVLGGRFRLARGDAGDLKSEAESAMRNRKAKQPLTWPNAGSVFKNPGSAFPAGQLIDMAGLKGTTVGGAQISEKHANFIINRNGATASDIIRLMETVRETVSKIFGINLEPEVEIVGK